MRRNLLLKGVRVRVCIGVRVCRKRYKPKVALSPLLVYPDCSPYAVPFSCRQPLLMADYESLSSILMVCCKDGIGQSRVAGGSSPSKGDRRMLKLSLPTRSDAPHVSSACSQLYHLHHASDVEAARTDDFCSSSFQAGSDGSARSKASARESRTPRRTGAIGRREGAGQGGSGNLPLFTLTEPCIRFLCLIFGVYILLVESG